MALSDRLEGRYDQLGDFIRGRGRIVVIAIQVLIVSVVGSLMVGGGLFGAIGFLFVFGVANLVTALVKKRRRQRFEATGIPVVAKIDRISINKGEAGIVFGSTITVRFRDANANDVKATRRLSWVASDVGEINILYDPDNPRRIHIYEKTEDPTFTERNLFLVGGGIPLLPDMRSRPGSYILSLMGETRPGQYG